MKHLILPMLFFLASAAALMAAENTPEARLAAAGYTLPAPTKPVAAYVTWRRSGARPAPPPVPGQ